ncbi:TonB-dependent receptor [Thalassotalea sp. PLHSN55]|uniref:TonB-dependent receptor n=1 Tax=Thalassotalea sp. PLHSN55 TaxID=3435888 RepID=UPI003F83A27E
MRYLNSLSLITLALLSAYTTSSLASDDIESIIVIGKKPSFSLAQRAGSVDYMSAEELSYEHVNDTLELLSKVPGVYISRFNQGILNTDVAIRGFSADGSTPHAKLLIDGISSNLNNGYNELDQMFPLAMANMTVFKGTSDPSYGLFNTAGNYQVESRSDLNKEVEISMGSFNAKELQAYAGFETGKLTQNYFFGYRQSDGYRDHTNLDKFSASGRWAYQLSDDTSLTAIARIAGYEGDAPGFLTQEEALSDPTQSADYASQDGGEKSTEHFSLHLDHYFTDDLFWQLKTYGQHFERERWVRFTEESSIENRYDDQNIYGFNSKLTWTLDDSWELIWGADSEIHQVVEQRFGTIGDSRDRDESDVRRDHHYDLTAIGSYLKLNHEWRDLVSWNIGLRANSLSGNMLEYTPEGEEIALEMYDFGTILQPTFNMIVKPSDYYNIFFNYGQSFQHPFGKAAYTTGDINARQVSLNSGWETGTVLTPSDNLDLRLSYWSQHASDEFIMIDGTAQNLGETLRHGVDLALNWQATNNITVWANYTTVNSEVLTAGDGQEHIEGNEIFSVPEFTASLGVNYQVNEKLTTRLHLDAQGDYYINKENTGGQYGDYALLNASAEYDFGEMKLKVQLNNITDEYYEYVFDINGDGSSILHSPGDGRNVSVSLSGNF